MTEDMELIHGSGNVFRDVGADDADAKQLRALLAAAIIKTLDTQKLPLRQLQQRTGVAAADLSRIRNADLDRFTIDRLMKILNRLGSRVEVKVKLRRDTAAA